ncbi:LOW QUALITY PROTEIN: hypothetical protein V2J09_022738 [Rumex salicifolius]
MNYLIWNCCGAGSDMFHSILRSLLRHHSIDVLSLMETKISRAKRQKFVRDSILIRESGWKRGVIWVASSCFGTMTKCKCMLETPIRNSSNPGDTRWQGNDALSLDSNRFRHWVDGSCLIDLGFTGPPFTWSRESSNSSKIYKHLNRVFTNRVDSLDWPEARVFHLSTVRPRTVVAFFQVRCHTRCVKETTPFGGRLDHPPRVPIPGSVNLAG